MGGASSSRGDFDQTDLIFGSGVRLRGDKVAFVSSGAGQERLWHASLAGMTRCAPTPFSVILGMAGLFLLNDYPGYRDAFSPSKPKAASQHPDHPTDSGRASRLFPQFGI